MVFCDAIASQNTTGFSALGGMLAVFITSPNGGALLSLESVGAGIASAWRLRGYL